MANQILMLSTDKYQFDFDRSPYEMDPVCYDSVEEILDDIDMLFD